MMERIVLRALSNFQDQTKEDVVQAVLDHVCGDQFNQTGLQALTMVARELQVAGCEPLEVTELRLIVLIALHSSRNERSTA